MASEEPPEWLPDGWFMGIKTRRDGGVERVYTSPVSGYTFTSKSEVLHYLNFEKVDGLRPQSMVSGYNNHLEHDSPQTVVQEDSPLWLPRGWLLEIKTRKSGKKAGSKYKCYFDPSSGSRFYSKLEVFRFLEGGQISKGSRSGQISTENRSETSREIRSDNSDSPDNVLAQIESSPDGLPPGWIKEIRYRRNSSGLRKDPYYTDPVSGYVFRSKKDVFRYLETGTISRHAFKPKNNSSKYSIDEPESPPPIAARSLKQAGAAARRCLFVSSSPSSSIKIAGLPVEEPSFQNSEPGTPQRVEGPALSLVTLPETNNLKQNISQTEDASKVQVDQVCEPDILLEGLTEWPQEILEQAEVAAKFSGPVSNNLSNPSDMNLLDQVHMNTGELETLKSPELKQGKFLDPARSDKANPTTNPSSRRRVKKLAVRSVRTKVRTEDELGQGDEALLDSSNRMLLPQPVNMNSDDYHKSGDVANENLSEPKGMPCEKVDIKMDSDMPVIGMLSEQVDKKHPETPVNNKYEPEGRLSVEVDKKHPEKLNRKPESGVMASAKLRKKYEVANELWSDISSKRVTRSSYIASIKARDKQALSFPCRASKRLAGLEPGLTADIDVSYRSLRKMRVRESQSSMAFDHEDRVALKIPDNHETSHELASDQCRKTKGKEPILLDPEHEKEHPAAGQTDNKNKESLGAPMDELESVSHRTTEGKDPEPEREHPGAVQTDNEKIEPPFASPFGDAWPDPCIEFAFKTLTGDIPVFEDSLTIEDYFQQQMSPTLNPSTTSFGSSEDFAISDASAQLDGMKGRNTMSVKAQQESSLENGIQSGGDMNGTSKTIKVKN